MRPDRTVAWDDLVCQRVTRCLVCGRRPEYLEFAFANVDGVVLLTACCVLCRAKDPGMRELLVMLERRYREVPAR